MTNNEDLALKLKSAAEMATPGKWERGDGKHGGELLVYCDDALGSAVCEATSTYNSIPKLQRISNLTFIATANPANILALLADRDADKKRIAEYQHQLSRYSMSPGEAEQRRCESRVVRDALGYCMDSENVAPVDLYLKIEELRQRIAELESLTAEQDKRLITYAAIAAKNASEARTVSVKLNRPGIIKSPMGVQCEVWERAEVEPALYQAGIKLEVGE
ncbi:ead/Ea22-like family protein [Kosakonia cowanii]|uniref:ead/Ea22-like family protein n=1 Tax=Kosakonia cowanii TaxID=208223 RepID=UPI0028A2A108|nr:ead/Ea22-like family protein [Kosakonia cowanii]